MYASITTPIGKIFQPLLDAVGSILAFFYSLIPNYPIDVALLTILIMALLTPLTVKSTKNMAAMQALGPEMKKLQQKYKGPENRAQLNEEMMKLYKEHKVNPASGCLPMLLQMPAFFILYSVIRGMTNVVPATTKTIHGLTVNIPASAQPRYIPKTSEMYHNIQAAHGQLISFGMDFSEKLLSHHSSIFVAIPYLLLVVASVGLQYLQMSRLNARESRGFAGESPGGHVAKIHATYLRVYLHKCGGNSQCLFHRLERDPDSDPGDLVPSRHRGRTTDAAHSGCHGDGEEGTQGPGGGPHRAGPPPIEGGLGIGRR